MGFVPEKKKSRESTSLLIILPYHGFIKIEKQNFELHRSKVSEVHFRCFAREFRIYFSYNFVCRLQYVQMLRFKIQSIHLNKYTFKQHVKINENTCGIYKIISRI